MFIKFRSVYFDSRMAEGYPACQNTLIELFWILTSGIWAVPLLVKAVSPWLISRGLSLLLWVIDEWLLQETVIIKLKLFSSFTRVFFGWGDCESPWQPQDADTHLQRRYKVGCLISCWRWAAHSGTQKSLRLSLACWSMHPWKCTLPRLTKVKHS